MGSIGKYVVIWNIKKYSIIVFWITLVKSSSAYDHINLSLLFCRSLYDLIVLLCLTLLSLFVSPYSAFLS